MKFDKIIYIKGINTTSFFHKTKKDMMIRWSKLEHLTYCNKDNLTKFIINDSFFKRLLLPLEGISYHLLSNL